MTRKTAQDFDQELLILFDAYVHGTIDRRGFLERAQKFATQASLRARCWRPSAQTLRRASRSRKTISASPPRC